jgi:zinc protease
MHQTEIDGVPTVWMAVPGPLRAALTVRVGCADETFLTAGISHLLEHLALFGLGRPGDHSNGFVDQTRTVFTVEGDDSEICGFLGALTRQLADPPVQRLDDERGVIDAEHGRRGLGPADSQLIWRYGAASYGLAGMEQLGVRRVSGADLGEWSRRFATRANSVLWISGPPPAGLRLHLPDGHAQPAPDPRRSILPWSPAWFTGPDDRVILDALVTRSWAASALSELLRGRLVDELRTRRAVAYSPDTAYLRLTRDTARLIASTDLVAGRQSEGVRPMLNMLEKLGSQADSAHAVQPGELEAWVARQRRGALDPQQGLGQLDAAAWDILHGDPVQDHRQWLHEVAQVSGEQVAAVAREACETLLAQIPQGLAPLEEKWQAAPSSQQPRFTGREYPSLHRDRRPPSSIRLGAEGITILAGEDHLSVARDSTVAVLRWSDGRRVLVGADGIRLQVEPTLWRDGAELVAQVDAQWAGDLAIDMGTRPPNAVPKPAPAPAMPLSRRLTGSRAYRFVRTLPWPGLTLPVILLLSVPLLVAVVVLAENTDTSVPLVPLALVAGFGIKRFLAWRAAS